MMRNLGIVILLSAASLAQTPVAPSSAANPAAQPATVSVQAAQVGVAKSAKPATTTQAKTGAPTAHKSVVTPQKNPDAGAKARAGSTAKSASQKPATVAAAKPQTKPVALTATSAKPVQKAAPQMPVAKTVAVKASVPTAKVAVAVPGHAPSAVAISAKPAAGSARPPVVPVKVQSRATAAVHPPVKVGTASSARPKPVSVKATKAPERTSVSTKAVVATAPKPEAAVQENKPAADNNAPSKEIHFEGRRDPFVSPVIAMGTLGSGCNTGKQCLTIDQVNLKGVVKSEAGMIAVVTNSVDKAYFLRENDPVFNGYVVKITGDSIVFKETFHDRLGKTLTRDVTKTITRPSA
jgi:hypothetical protein